MNKDYNYEKNITLLVFILQITLIFAQDVFLNGESWQMELMESGMI
jgi:hypothetical protein